jgi:hypothetical protein
VRLTVSKFVALGIAVIYVVLLVARGDADASTTCQYGVFLLLVLGLIWFPEQVGEFAGYVGRGGNIDLETPPLLVSLAGWFFLVGLPVLVWWLSR